MNELCHNCTQAVSSDLSKLPDEQFQTVMSTATKILSHDGCMRSFCEVAVVQSQQLVFSWSEYDDQPEDGKSLGLQEVKSADEPVSKGDEAIVHVVQAKCA